MKPELSKRIEQIALELTGQLSVLDTPADRFDGGFPPYCTDMNNELAKKFTKSVTKVCGKEPQISYFEAIGDFNYIGGTLGIPTVMFGAAGDHFHSCDEYVCLNSATETAESLYQFFEDVLV